MGLQSFFGGPFGSILNGDGKLQETAIKRRPFLWRSRTGKVLFAIGAKRRGSCVIWLKTVLEKKICEFLEAYENRVTLRPESVIQF
jgi:hypothetical protein